MVSQMLPRRKAIASVNLALFAAIAVLPIALGGIYALLYSFGLAGIIHSGFTFNYWKEVFSSFEILLSFLYSFYLASISILISVSLALWLTLALRRSLQQGFLSYAIYLPLAIPAIVAAFFIFQILSKAGLLSRLAFNWRWIQSLDGFPDLVNDTFGIGIIAAHVMLAAPFFIILFGNLFESENLENLQQLATSLGANSQQVARQVTIPILLNRAFPTLALYFVFVLGSYEIPLLLGRQSPQMISVLVSRKLQRFDLLDIPEAYIIALVYLLLVGALMISLFRKKKLVYDF